MKTASDFRRSAREALRGKWRPAIAAGVLASLLGGADGFISGLRLNVDLSQARAKLTFAGLKLFSLGNTADTTAPLPDLLLSSPLFWLLALLLSVLLVILASVVAVGYARFQLELSRGYTPSPRTVFAFFHRWKTITASSILRSLYGIAWTLLLVFPGILAALSYSMTDFILAERTDLSANQAISLSKAMMYGHRWRFLCLNLSFIGWNLLTVLTGGIAALWVAPYLYAAQCAFYREVSEIYYAAGH